MCKMERMLALLPAREFSGPRLRARHIVSTQRGPGALRLRKAAGSVLADLFGWEKRRKG